MNQEKGTVLKMRFALVYDNTCIACNVMQKFIKKFDVKDNISSIHFDDAVSLLQEYFYKGRKVPRDVHMITTMDNGTSSKAYRGRNAFPQIIRAILWRD